MRELSCAQAHLQQRHAPGGVARHARAGDDDGIRRRHRLWRVRQRDRRFEHTLEAHRIEERIEARHAPRPLGRASTEGRMVRAAAPGWQ
ncbi:hypothetical protein [Sorangium sp. So ce1151]|uniref:hypothetical protein n=1 Tax=Sorangium sp. So ce1151 TaxID=3133332 RepID=UPI003F6203DF